MFDATREKTRLWLLLLIGVVATLLGQTHAREIFAPSPHESGIFATQTQASTGENYDGIQYDALDSLLAANGGGKVFWSGGTPARQAAEAFAQQTGAKTLEMTKTGRFLDAITTDKTYPFLRPAWDAASKRFANGAGATTDVFQSTSRGVRLESVWATKEYPQLLKQGTQINYHPAP